MFPDFACAPNGKCSKNFSCEPNGKCSQISSSYQMVNVPRFFHVELYGKCSQIEQQPKSIQIEQQPKLIHYNNNITISSSQMIPNGSDSSLQKNKLEFTHLPIISTTNAVH